MDSQKVDLYVVSNGKYFDSNQIGIMREMLVNLDDAKWPQLQTVSLKDPTTSLIVSILGGHFGIDRFIIGDTGLGIAKLLTCGGLGIWSIVDWFMIMGRTREKNLQKLQAIFA